MAQWWDEWQLRILVLASLAAQYLLVLSARARKFHIPPWLKVSFRLVHLGSDALAIFALATLFNRQKGGPRCSYARGSRDLELLWAPILVMHLGGQVVITTFKIDDNEQWRRHVLTSLSKVVVALYVFYKSWSSHNERLLAATILLFILVIIRSFQKALNLKSSSFNTLRKASSFKVVRLPFRSAQIGLEGFVRAGESAVQHCGETVDLEADPNCGDHHGEVVLDGGETVDLEANYPPYQPPRQTSMCMDPTEIYQLFLDLPYPYPVRLEILKSFWSLDCKSACQPIEGALSAMTSFLYTKDGTTRPDFNHVTLLLILRRWTESLVTYATLIAAICLVHTGSHKEAYSGEDTWGTFVLLYGTLLLELIYIAAGSAFQDKFSGKILQHNLIGLVAHNKWHSKLTRISACLGCKELVDEYFWHMKPNYSSCRDITELVRGHVQSGWQKYIRNVSCYRKFNDSRGDWTLYMNGCLEQLDWSIQKPFDESIILWHLATDFCFHHEATSPDDQCARRCIEISNYMMHLLYENPEMLLPGSRKSLLPRICGQVHEMLQSEKPQRDKRDVTRRIMEIFKARHSEFVSNTGRIPPEMEIIRDTGIIGHAWMLAQTLLYDDLGDQGGQTRMWKVIKGVWVEMLCFSAGRSRGYLHAEALGTGVEYLSYVWILLAYSGMETFSERLQRMEGLSFDSDKASV